MVPYKSSQTGSFTQEGMKLNRQGDIRIVNLLASKTVQRMTWLELSSGTPKTRLISPNLNQSFNYYDGTNILAFLIA